LTPYRSQDAAAILDILAIGQPVGVAGLSNFGKSTLLRHMAEPQMAQAYANATGRGGRFVYIDCNGMLEMSAQGFYEVILRAIQETLSDNPQLRHNIEGLYQKLVESHGSFAIPLAFNEAIIVLMEDDHDVILLLDEFDAVLTELDERVFLNLRALKDKYVERLNYVTATLQPLASVGGGDDLSEFLELFNAYKYNLRPLSPADATDLAAEIFRQANDHLDLVERDYILEQAGGHPGLVQAVAHVVLEVESGAPETYTERALSVAGDVLESHRLVRVELSKLWKQLLSSEREAATLVATRGVSVLTDAQRMDLLTRGVLIHEGNNSEPRLFARLLTHYARRQGLIQLGTPEGVWVDIDAGMVLVDGQQVESLTDLEYRLLLLLYGRLDKICDKYQIVEAVWGQEYLGEVDDARIEKLISRLRSKLEPDPAHPQYISTVRGRGYKLTSSKETPEEL
jgi:DNA-binding winged helix-turn-helix (wHTH) protein/GTP-binding protein EngB required for normal cell division